MEWIDVEQDPAGPPVLVAVAAGMLKVSRGFLENTIAEEAHRRGQTLSKARPPLTVDRHTLLMLRTRFGNSWDWRSPEAPAGPRAAVEVEP